MSLARNHYISRMALVASVGAAGALAATSGVAAEQAPERDTTGPGADQYQLLLLDLRADRVALKQVASIERKIELKRQLLPKYDGWVAGVLEAAETGADGVQDDVLATVLAWRIDTGDFDGALPIFAYALKWKLRMPEEIAKRSVATFVTEEIAEAALKLLADGKPAPYEAMAKVATLIEGSDMHDQVRAKLEKAFGQEFVRVAADDKACADAAVPGAHRLYKERALSHFKRAIALNSAVGVKKEIDRLERELKKPAEASNAGEQA